MVELMILLMTKTTSMTMDWPASIAQSLMVFIVHILLQAIDHNRQHRVSVMLWSPSSFCYSDLTKWPSGLVDKEGVTGTSLCLNHEKDFELAFYLVSVYNWCLTTVLLKKHLIWFKYYSTGCGIKVFLESQPTTSICSSTRRPSIFNISLICHVNKTSLTLLITLRP